MTLHGIWPPSRASNFSNSALICATQVLQITTISTSTYNFHIELRHRSLGHSLLLLSDPELKGRLPKTKKSRERDSPSRIRRGRTRHHNPDCHPIDLPVQRPKRKGGWSDGREGRIGRVDHEPARGEGQGLEGGGVEAGFGGEAAGTDGRGGMVMAVAFRGDAEGGFIGDCVGEDWEDEKGE